MNKVIKYTLAAAIIAASLTGPAFAASADKGEETNQICIPIGEDIFFCFPFPILLNDASE